MTGTMSRTPRAAAARRGLKVAPESVKRLKGLIRAVFRKGRGRAVGRVITDLTPLITGWTEYFKLADVKQTFEELDEWLRRKLRCILWRQWKTPRTRAKKLMVRGIDQRRASLQWSGTVVECRCLSHECSSAGEVVCTAGTRELPREASKF
jgi:hypothetical protein